MAEPEPLPDDIQALLRSAQGGAPPPPAGAADTVLTKVSATVSATVGAPLAAGAAAASVAWVKPLAGLALAALVSVGVIGAMRTDDEVRAVSGPVAVLPDAPPRPVPPQAVPPQPIAAPPVVTPQVIEQVAEPAEAPQPEAHAPEAQAPASAPRARSPSRAAEGALLEAARDALARGDADAAIAKLEDHQKEFGARGQLVEERHALTVVAFAQKGERARAQSAAKAFLRLYPDSLFGDTVRAAAGSE